MTLSKFSLTLKVLHSKIRKLLFMPLNFPHFFEELPWTYLMGQTETGDNETLIKVRAGIPNMNGEMILAHFSM